MKIISILFLLTACGGMSANAEIRAKMAQLHEDLDGGIGKFTTHGFAKRWGLPERRDTIDESEFWTYIDDLGDRRSGGAYTNPYTNITTSRGGVVRRYNKITLEFKDGLLVGWTADIRR